MNTTLSPVPFQTFDVMGGTVRPAPARPPAAPRPASAGPLVDRLPGLLPEASAPVFVGETAAAPAEAYQRRHPGADVRALAWDDAALAAAVSRSDLIVVVGAPDCLGLSAGRLDALAAVSPVATPLFVATLRGPASIDALCALLMNAGWMPNLLPEPESTGDTPLQVLEAVRRFEPAPQAAPQPALFSVVVPTTATRSEATAAAESPGLAEVEALVLAVADAGCAAEAFDAAAPALDTPWVLLCRDDAYFPAGFGHRLNAVLDAVPAHERASTLIGFIGIGVDARQQGFAPAGFVVEHARREDHPATAAAVSIDELAVVVARESLHRIDPSLGWHLWATDLCLSAICEHKVFPRIVALPLLHRAAPTQALPAQFHASARRLLEKHPSFGPIPTLNGTIDAAFVARGAAPAFTPAPAPAEAAPPAPAAPRAAPAAPFLSLRGEPLPASAVSAPAAVVGHCSVCGQGVSQWTPHPQRALRSEFMKLLDTVGSDLSVYLCPHCGSNDRDRHLWHYLRAVGLVQRLPSARILHIAPERHLEALIEAAGPRAYVRGDLQPRRADHLKLDVEALPFEAESFDLVVCNHVLEHVASPLRALGEFHRCLSPGGVLVAQTPYSPQLRNTLELNRPVSPAFAKLFYGQEDHVRLFGADIAGYFHAAGFSGEPLPHEAVLGDMDARAQGCNGREPFFVFSK